MTGVCFFFRRKSQITCKQSVPSLSVPARMVNIVRNSRKDCLERWFLFLSVKVTAEKSLKKWHVLVFLRKVLETSNSKKKSHRGHSRGTCGVLTLTQPGFLRVQRRRRTIYVPFWDNRATQTKLQSSAGQNIATIIWGKRIILPVI